MEEIIHYLSVPGKQVLIPTAFAFLGGGLAFIIAVLTSRVWKSARAKKGHLLQTTFRNMLNDLVVSESLSHAHRPQSAIEFKIAELNTLQRSRFAKQKRSTGPGRSPAWRNGEIGIAATPCSRVSRMANGSSGSSLIAE